MLLRVSAPGEVVLEAPDDFRHFAIRIDGGGQPRAAWLAGWARPDGDAHAWVDPDAVRRLAPNRESPDWQAGFAAMLDFARKHDWLDAHGHIRAHIEAAPTA